MAHPTSLLEKSMITDSSGGILLNSEVQHCVVTLYIQFVNGRTTICLWLLQEKKLLKYLSMTNFTFPNEHTHSETQSCLTKPQISHISSSY